MKTSQASARFFVFSSNSKALVVETILGRKGLGVKFLLANCSRREYESNRCFLTTLNARFQNVSRETGLKPSVWLKEARVSLL